MIFKTIDDNDSLSGQRIVSKFTARKIAQEEATKQLEIDIQCLRNYEVECQKGSVSTETFSNTMKGASIEAQKYATNIKNGTGSAQTFATNQRTIQASMSETSIVSKVATTGLSIFKAALNSLIFFAVIEGIQLLIKGIDNLILTADEAEEKAEALRGNMQSFFDEVQSGQQTISSVSDRFSELSEHVTKTGENIDLTKDEYSEYLDICNQVKTIMPELVTGYTNEGNAIITLKDNVDSLTESYKENIRAKAAAFITNGDDDGNTIQSFFDDYKIFTEGENGLFVPSVNGLWNNKSTDYEDYYGYDKVHKWLEEAANATLEELTSLRGGTLQGSYLQSILNDSNFKGSIADITEENYEQIHDILDTRLTSLEGEMATRVSNVKMSLQQMLYADRDYWDIDDKEALSAIDLMFSSIDSEFIKQNNLLGQDALQSFESNVIKLFEDKDTQKAMIDIYTPQGDDESIEDYSKRVNDAIEEVQNYTKDKKIDIPLDFTYATNNVEDLQKSYDNTINRFKSDTSDLSTEELDSLNKQFDEQTQSLAEAKENLQNEYDKISDWGLDDYADQIKNNTIQTKFGNVDMDKRTIIHWSNELKQTYADALASWDYDPEVGSIDTVFGGSERFGEELNGNGWEVAFTPILSDGTFLSKDTVEEYINSILEEAYADDGKVTEDELTAIDAQGRQVGDTFVKGIFAGIDDSQNYDNNGNWAEVVGRLMHFAGNFGAKQLADQGIDDANTKLEETKKKIEEVSKRFDDSQKIKDFFDTEGINTDEEINEFNKVTEGINRADEAIQKWNEHKKEGDNSSSFTKDPTDLLRDADDKDRKDKSINLADLKNRADLMKTIKKEIQETGNIGVDTLQKLSKQYPEAKEALYDYMTGVKNEAELFTDLENIYNDDKSQYINSMVEQNQANEDFFNSLKAKYPEIVTEMQNLVDQTNALLDRQKENYINSIVSEEESCQAFLNFIRETYPELYAQLSEIYGNDEENFIRHIISENETNQEFIDALLKLYPALANNLATTYGNDVSNWTSMEQAKAQITANLINQLNEMWSEYFDEVSETFGAFGSIMENADGSGYTFLSGQDDLEYCNHNMTAEEWQDSQKAVQSYNAVKEKMQNAINLTNATVKNLEGAAYNSIESSVGGLDYDSLGKDISSDSDKGSSDDSDSGSEPTPEDFDWIERCC